MKKKLFLLPLLLLGCLTGCTKTTVRGIDHSYLTDNGELVLVYTDGTEQNVGSVKGQDGSDGKDGADGKDGKDGVDGQNGLNGRDGQDGLNGQNGLNGRDGQTGESGQDGKDGKDGTSILTGYGVPSPSLGNIGDVYIDTTSGAIYKKEADGQWYSNGSVRGDTGATGANGKDGKDAFVKVNSYNIDLDMDIHYIDGYGTHAMFKESFLGNYYWLLYSDDTPFNLYFRTTFAKITTLIMWQTGTEYTIDNMLYGDSPVNNVTKLDNTSICDSVNYLFSSGAVTSVSDVKLTIQLQGEIYVPYWLV